MILKRQSHNKDVFRSINISFKLLLSTRQQPTLDPEVSLPQVKLKPGFPGNPASLHRTHLSNTAKGNLGSAFPF